MKAQLARVKRSEIAAHGVACDASILDGASTPSDILDHPLLPLIEDAVAQQGQGEIVDRSLERLGRTDIGIVRMQRPFERKYQQRQQRLALSPDQHQALARNCGISGLRQIWCSGGVSRWRVANAPLNGKFKI
jgi:hypothetical protein